MNIKLAVCTLVSPALAVASTQANLEYDNYSENLNELIKSANGDAVKELKIFESVEVDAQGGDIAASGVLCIVDAEDYSEYCLKAAREGVADAQYAIGLMHYHGRGFKADEEVGLEWVRKAANQGHGAASVFLLAD
ncbi:tetratricopeptide repeat protein [Vibrio crassostreae]|uniref:tetratricopeptide repeat protein n=1 Tax=Vibrio crassostreae TaxID=246167 RepID=UPI001B30A56A|nr:SEL1-like repeat protein [Vibrio crassostreae]